MPLVKCVFYISMQQYLCLQARVKVEEEWQGAGWK